MNEQRELSSIGERVNWAEEYSRLIREATGEKGLKEVKSIFEDDLTLLADKEEMPFNLNRVLAATRVTVRGKGDSSTSFSFTHHETLGINLCSPLSHEDFIKIAAEIDKTGDPNLVPFWHTRQRQVANLLKGGAIFLKSALLGSLKADDPLLRPYLEKSARILFQTGSIVEGLTLPQDEINRVLEQKAKEFNSNLPVAELPGSQALENSVRFLFNGIPEPVSEDFRSGGLFGLLNFDIWTPLKKIRSIEVYRKIIGWVAAGGPKRWLKTIGEYQSGLRAGAIRTYNIISFLPIAEFFSSLMLREWVCCVNNLTFPDYLLSFLATENPEAKKSALFKMSPDTFSKIYHEMMPQSAENPRSLDDLPYEQRSRFIDFLTSYLHNLGVDKKSRLYRDWLDKEIAEKYTGEVQRKDRPNQHTISETQERYARKIVDCLRLFNGWENLAGLEPFRQSLPKTILEQKRMDCFGRTGITGISLMVSGLAEKDGVLAAVPRFGDVFHIFSLTRLADGDFLILEPSGSSQLTCRITEKKHGEETKEKLERSLKLYGRAIDVPISHGEKTFSHATVDYLDRALTGYFLHQLTDACDIKVATTNGKRISHYNLIVFLKNLRQTLTPMFN